MTVGKFITGALFGLALAAAPAFASSSFSITATFDSTITNDTNAANIEATINAVIAIYDSTFIVPGPLPVTANITFAENSSGLGMSSAAFDSVAYTTYCAALQGFGTLGSGTLNCATDPFATGGGNIGVKTVDERALGIGGATASDGTITLNTTITSPGAGAGTSGAFPLAPVVSHEIDEVLGLSSGLDNINSTSALITAAHGPFAQDLWRFTGIGALAFNVELGATCNGGSPQTTPAFFSVDGGNSSLAGFNNTCNGADWGDWDGAGGPRVQNAFDNPGDNPSLGVEIQALEAVGFQSAAPEPATFGLIGVALAGLVAARRRYAKH